MSLKKRTYPLGKYLSSLKVRNHGVGRWVTPPLPFQARLSECRRVTGTSHPRSDRRTLGDSLTQLEQTSPLPTRTKNVLRSRPRCRHRPKPPVEDREVYRGLSLSVSEYPERICPTSVLTINGGIIGKRRNKKYCLGVKIKHTVTQIDFLVHKVGEKSISTGCPTLVFTNPSRRLFHEIVSRPLPYTEDGGEKRGQKKKFKTKINKIR